MGYLLYVLGMLSCIAYGVMFNDYKYLRLIPFTINLGILWYYSFIK